MTSLKVNADYESVLFHGKPAPRQLNDSIEFLALFLEKTPLFSQKKYSKEYLSYVESITGHSPQFTTTGSFRNWWGELKNPELEKKLNSKLTSAQFIIDKGWCKKTFILDQKSDINQIPWGGHYIVKDPHGMSGQKFQILSENKLPLHLLAQGPVIMEPLFNRIHDFSHYVYPDGKVIAYQNFIDQKFQFKGTFFSDNKNAKIEDLSFYADLQAEEWSKFQNRLDEIIKYYRSLGAKEGFSIDSFTYLEDGEIKIRALSEINYRRTMGRVAFELSQRYAEGRPWSLFILTRAMDFEKSKLKLDPLLSHLTTEQAIILLAPGDTRFSMFMLSAKNQASGNKLIEAIGALLPGGEFPVKIENDLPCLIG